MSAENGHRWSKFWWGDYQSSAELRFCGLSARGYWMELLCIMHSASPPGHLLVNGKQPTYAQLAAIAGCSVRDAKRQEVALEAAGVFSRTTDGVIYCRRMVRDAAASTTGKQAAEKRWKASDKPTAHPNGSANGNATPNPNARVKKQKKEAEEKEERRLKESKLSSPVPREAADQPTNEIGEALGAILRADIPPEPYGPVRSRQEQINELKAEPDDNPDAMGEQWQPANAIRSPAEQYAELLGIPLEEATKRLTHNPHIPTYIRPGTQH